MFLTLLHTIGWIIFTFYAVIFPKNWLDIYYLCFFITTALSWVLFKGECIISLVEKLKKDPTYKIGTNKEASDLINVFGEKYSDYVRVFSQIAKCIRVVSIYIVLERNHYPYSIWISIIFLLVSFDSYKSILRRVFYFIALSFILMLIIRR